METEHIKKVVLMYKKRLELRNIQPQRMNIKMTPPLESEVLPHAHYLVNSVLHYLKHDDKYGKINRHLSSIQNCLLFAGWYTISDLMKHNKPR